MTGTQRLQRLCAVEHSAFSTQHAGMNASPTVLESLLDWLNAEYRVLSARSDAESLQ